MKALITFSLFFLSYALFPQDSQDPCQRNQPVIAYHEKAKAIFLFGGYCSQTKSRLNDLWKYSNGRWIEIQSDLKPEARSGHSMIYDKEREALVVFGGKNDKGELLNDLWNWDGHSWKRISDGGPEKRQSHRMVSLSEGDGLFLFGGSNIYGSPLGDSWLFKDGAWTEISGKGPPGRLQHTMCFDLRNKKVILFGGFTKIENQKHVYGDTWEWGQSTGWKLVANNSGLARDHHAMSFDTCTNTAILFGGYNGGYLGETLGWTGESWEVLSESGPSPRAGKPGLIFHSDLNRTVLFGGWDESNKPLMDFWIFDGNRRVWAGL